MPFLPASCRERSQKWFQCLLTTSQPERHNTTALRPSLHSGESFLLAFLTPEMRMAQALPWQVEPNFDPYAYTEHLVVLAEHANEPADKQNGGVPITAALLMNDHHALRTAP